MADLVIRDDFILGGAKAILPASSRVGLRFIRPRAPKVRTSAGAAQAMSCELGLSGELRHAPGMFVQMSSLKGDFAVPYVGYGRKNALQQDD